MQTSVARKRCLLFFLWLAVSTWGIGLDAELFELTVLIPAWAANPPQSLSLLAYGARWPNNPGDFFQPLSAALALATLGVIVAGWQTLARFKTLRWIFYDWIRAAFIGIGFVASLQAMSLRSGAWGGLTIPSSGSATAVR